jgi:RNA polymerase sigma-70 factor (ECF subfamily)
MAVASMRLEVATAYTDHAASVTRYLTGLTRDPAVAEDLAQEAFLRLMGEVEAGRTPNNVGGWLFRVAANLAASRGRHLSVVSRHTAELAVDEGRGKQRSPEEAAIGRERALAIQRVLARLRGPDREILLLAANGLGRADLARHIGKSEIATRTMLCRARARLRDELALDGFEW